MTFKFNERVRVTKWSNEYDGKYRGMVGVVKYTAYTGRYGIELDGLRNVNSKMGLFWFDESHLIPDKDKKEILVGDLKNGYSYITPKEAEEIRMQRETVEKMRSETEDMIAKIYSSISFNPPRSVEIKKVIFNNPAIIVFWSDGKKTVVKCAGDEAFDEEKGLAMAISKRVLGNKGNYYNEFKKWLPKIEVSCGGKNCDECDDFDCKNTPDDEDKDVTIGVIKTYSDIDEPIRKTFVGDE